MSEGQRTSGGNCYSPTMCVSGTEFRESGLAPLLDAPLPSRQPIFSVLNQQLQLREDTQRLGKLTWNSSSPRMVFT